MSKPVILGAGLAGVTAALALAPMPVVLVSPRKLGEGCSSAWAQGGIAAALGADDEAALHAEDTIAAGNGLNDAVIVRQTVQDAGRVIETLAGLGVAFDRDASGALRLGLEAAHRRRRIVHATDATGAEVMRALIGIVRATPSIEVIEEAVATELVVGAEGIEGVVLARGGDLTVLRADAVVLATGGAAGLWRDTTNPHENWGGGLALAARAGATLADLEFVQFHPTAIDIGRDPMPLASEALRGEGAVLIDEKGARFIDELQPRDIVARAIWQRMEEGHRVFLDAREALGETFAKRFPTIYGFCASAGIDAGRQPIPVRPAAHYHMGGVVTDAGGRTDVKGLWACGEVASTGLHGANRLASNSLLEAASFGRLVAEGIKGEGHREKGGGVLPRGPSSLRSYAGSGRLVRRSHLAERERAALDSRFPLYALRASGDRGRGNDEEERKGIRAVMSDCVGVTRGREGLEKAAGVLAKLGAESDMGLVGAMVAWAALRREESRGAHCRVDFPQKDDEGRRSFFRLADMDLLTEEV